MDKITTEEIRDLVILIIEAKDFLELKHDNDGNIRKNIYLLNDIKDAVEVVLNTITQDKSSYFFALTQRLIQKLEIVFSEDDDFRILVKLCDEWIEMATFEIAEKYYSEKNYNKAAHEYDKLISASSNELKAISFHRLGQVYSSTNPMEAYHYYKESFRVNDQVVKYFVASDHPSYHYVYGEVDESYQEVCHFCGIESKPYFCAESYRGLSFNKIYSPVKVWMRCESCDHIFSLNNPTSLRQLKYEGVNFRMMPPKYAFLPTIGEILIRLQQYSKGQKLLDVGIGGGELLAVAKELQFDVEGLEIVELQAKHVSTILNIEVHACDFLEYMTNKRYNLITLGDVIEHIEDPVKTIQKAYELLDDQGVFWISTPNYNSAFASFVKFEDAMWKEAGHLHYFSYTSLRMVLENNGFEVIGYNLSKNYKGSMEVTALKKTRS
ncbi:class I SAM-dependent methyltransferase [Paenibacillus sp. HGF5]|uniref:class I SAM-dependent methyltransferase n=1 Tax=Paenibacillus sp. HGF5 TaxID=908341 RepID=UPI0002071BF3|nr:class I SAM-dependent methyltransferase [Paenibacillus sp. HGF5]EGG33971.1 methyltransferase domain protein [Paenibacillus sp. HGF5]